MPIIGVIASSGDRNVPDAPTIGTATNVPSGRAFNNGRADVTFTAPVYTGGTPITGYTVTSSPGGFTGTGASSPISVTGLQSNTAYTFTVTATNAIGTSAPSAASNSITATTVPQAPTIGTATDTGTGTSVSVAFTANATGGSAITGFTATSSPGSITGTGGSSPITVGGLTAGTAYTFTVTATNANGTSAASSASNSVTPQIPSDWVLLGEQVYGGGPAVYLSFSGISTEYTQLYLTWTDWHTQDDTNGLGPILLLSGGGSSYSLSYTSATYSQSQGSGGGTFSWITTYFYFFNTNVNGGVGTNTSTTARASHMLTLPNYKNTNFLRGGQILGGTAQRPTTQQYQSINDGYNNVGATTATTTINLGMYSGGPDPTNPFGAGSRFSIWGIR